VEIEDASYTEKKQEASISFQQCVWWDFLSHELSWSIDISIRDLFWSSMTWE